MRDESEDTGERERGREGRGGGGKHSTAERCQLKSGHWHPGFRKYFVSSAELRCSESTDGCRKAQREEEVESRNGRKGVTLIGSKRGLESCVRCSLEHLGRDFPSYSERGEKKK